MIDPAAVTANLKAAGVNVVADKGGRVWLAKYDGDAPGDEQVTVLLLPQSEPEYFIAMSPVISGRLHGKRLDELSIESLRTIVRVNSEESLAKIEYSEVEMDKKPSGIFFATSQCSTDEYSGAKLSRRMLACATLARRLVAALDSEQKSA